MRIVLTGSRGFIGSALITALKAGGHLVVPLVRSKTAPAPGSAAWDPEAGFLAAGTLEDSGAIVHLAGEPIASARWSRAQRDRILNSRVKSTRLLCKTLEKMSSPPGIFVSASAIGYYGDRGDEILTEESPPGRGFLADVCKQWEAETSSAAQRGIHVVLLRIGMVLSGQGGALARMLPAFRAGLGGAIGSGRQYMSWITLHDLVQIIQRCITDPGLRGPVLAVAPNPVTNRDFTKTLARVLHRPAVLGVPACAVRLAFGQMADELLLASQRARPEKLMAAGYNFQFPVVESALRNALAL